MPDIDTIDILDFIDEDPIFVDQMPSQIDFTQSHLPAEVDFLSVPERSFVDNDPVVSQVELTDNNVGVNIHLQQAEDDLSEILLPGIQGPKGERGDPGQIDNNQVSGIIEQYIGSHPVQIPPFSYYHVQNTSSSVWTVNHNLGYNPAITVINSAGEEVEGDVQYIDATTVQLTFAQPFGGTATAS